MPLCVRDEKPLGHALIEVAVIITYKSFMCNDILLHFLVAKDRAATFLRGCRDGLDGLTVTDGDMYN